MSLRKDIEENFRRIMEKVDRVSDKEAELDFDELEDQDLDNDGDSDGSDEYLHKKLGMVAKMDEATTETGLTFTPRSSADATKLQNALDNSDFHYEWNSREGYFFFPEEEDNYDELESNLQQIVDSIDINGHFEGIWLDEVSTTAGVPGFDSPYAFGKADKDTIEADGWEETPKSRKFIKAEGKSSTYKRMMSEMYGVQSVNEAVSYREYKKDESATPSQKVNKSIMEVNKMLAEIERVVAQNLKLKNESGVNSGQFWKSTGVRFSKINERMVRISNRLKELSK
jgi:hypothetical protein